MGTIGFKPHGELRTTWRGNKKKKRSSYTCKLQPLQRRHVVISQASLSSLQRFNSDESKPGVYLATQIEEFAIFDKLHLWFSAWQLTRPAHFLQTYCLQGPKLPII